MFQVPLYDFIKASELEYFGCQFKVLFIFVIETKESLSAFRKSIYKEARVLISQEQIVFF